MPKFNQTSKNDDNDLSNTYHANRARQQENNIPIEKQQEKSSQQDANKKTAKVAAKAAANYFTGGKGGAVVDKLADTKLGNAALNKMGNSFMKKNPGLQKAARKLNDSGALDAADKAMDMGAGGKYGGAQSNPGSTNGNNAISPGSGEQPSGKPSLPGGLSGVGEGLKNPFSKKSSMGESNSSSKLFSANGFIAKNKMMLMPFFVMGAFLILIIFGITAVISSSSEDGKGNEVTDPDATSCTYTSSGDTSTKKKIRTTTYQYCANGSDCSLGGFGGLNQYIRNGDVYFDQYGYAFIKGGTRGFGEKGKDYLIVATAHKLLIGQYGYNQNNQISYYNYGDTFSLELNLKGKKSTHNAIVLDACGACMSWSTTSTDKYSPSSSSQLKYCSDTNNTKVDLLTKASGATATNDTAYMMNGTSSNVCVGEVDLGNITTGIADTKLLQDKTVKDIYGESGITELNNQIKANSDKYGSGTGKGVSAAAITLINSLKSKGYRLPYYWAGGHGIISNGVLNTWGSKISASCSSTTCYYYNSLDCSGFVSWAIKNGGCNKFNSPYTSSTFGKVGKAESESEVKAGDILVNPGSHVVLVVQNNAGKIVLAESSGGTGGVHFTDYNTSYKNNTKYHFRDMSSFYSSTSCK